MPSIGEQGWGELVSNNFEILDNVILNNLNNLQDQIDVINTNIGDGTRTITLTGNSSNIRQYWENSVWITYITGNHTLTANIKPSSSARMCLLICIGNLTISTGLDTYPTSLSMELPPSSESTNTYRKTISTNSSDTITLPYTKSNNSAVLSVSKSDLKSFLDAINNTSINYTLSIPAATAAGGNDTNGDGTAGSASNTCNGGGGGGNLSGITGITGGTGCIFGQYKGGANYGDNPHRNGYGYGDNTYIDKYRCALVIIAFGNLTIKSTITQNGGNGSGYNGGTGGYGGGAIFSGGGGAPVFIYYTGSYINNGTINTAGGNKHSYLYGGSNGGAGGIKTTQISI